MAKARLVRDTFFDGHGATYARHANWRHCHHLNSYLRSRILALSPGLCIDVGAGDRSVLAETAIEASVICIDVSVKMLRRNRGGHALKVLGEIGALPILSESVDLIYASQSLHYVCPISSGAEIARVLKKNGRLIVVQLTDSDAVSTEWYAKWKSLKGPTNRLYSSVGQLVQWAHSYRLVSVDSHRILFGQWLDWASIYEKYEACNDFEKQNRVRLFFEGATDLEREHLGLRVDSMGVYLRRVISVLEFRMS